MRLITVDINKLYGIESKQDCPLTGYVHDNSKEIEQDRLRRAIIVCPGGAYVMTSDREAEPVALEFFARDYNVFVLRYNVYPKKFPTQLTELACAVDYLRKNADELGVMPGKIFVMGFSAGGHLAANLANDHARVSALCGKQLDCRPDGAVLGYPVITVKEEYRQTHEVLTGRKGCDSAEDFGTLNLDETVTDDNPPTFLWHTFADPLVPPGNSLRYAQALAAHKIRFELHVFPDGTHGLALADERTCAPGGNSINARAAEWTRFADAFLKSI